MTEMQPEQLRRVFSERVKARRKELGLTQEALAQRLHVKQPYIAILEGDRDDRSPTIDLVARVAEALQTSPSALLSTESAFSEISA